MSELVFLSFQKKYNKRIQKYDFSQKKLSKSLVFVSERANERFAKKNKWFAQSLSFVLSDLSESLTVAHLIWAIWANEQMSEWAMIKWENSQPCGA